MSRSSARAPRPRPPPPSPVGDLVTGGLLGAGAVIMGYALRELLRPTATAVPQSLVIGGVDLSSTDLRQPFLADFSVPASADVQTKHFALLRVRRALDELRKWQPTWFFKPVTDVAAGQFALYVVPIVPASEQSAVEGGAFPNAVLGRLGGR